MYLKHSPRRQVETDPVEIESVKVRILPDGRMNSRDAAKYLGRAPKTLAMWRMKEIGPPWLKRGRIFYFKDNLDAFIRGE